MKNIYDLEKDVYDLLVEHLPIRPFRKAREIIHEIVTAKEIEHEDYEQKESQLDD